MKVQRGAAILTALLLMALVATLSTAALWQQARAYDLEAAERARVQANWVLQGTTDWARLILREDARSGTVDHLGEPWAITLQEARLNTFLANGSASAEDLPTDVLQNAYLSGNINDLQARLNVTNLMLDQQVHEPTRNAFIRLFDLLKLPPAELQLLINNLQAGLEAPKAGQERTSSSSNTPLLPRNLDQLAWLGVSQRSLAQLRPYVVVLPDRSTVKHQHGDGAGAPSHHPRHGRGQCPTPHRQPGKKPASEHGRRACRIGLAAIGISRQLGQCELAVL